MTTTAKTGKSKTNNCRELLGKKLQVKWEIQGENLFVELIGRIKEDQYMAFGLSGAHGHPQMVFRRIFCEHNLQYRAEP